jgi:NTP pyrophosphatase (non-canonical NTP hydrolase)
MLMNNANSITHPELVAALAKPGDQIKEEVSGADLHLLHMGVGVSSDVGELLEAILQYGATGSLDITNVKEELGDIEFFMEGVRQAVGISREETTFIPPVSPDEGPLLLITDLGFACGASVSAGRLLDAIKRAVIYRKALSRENVGKELGLIDFFLKQLRDSLYISREETLAGNIEKLRKRYASMKFTNADAQARADKVNEDTPTAV